MLFDTALNIVNWHIFVSVDATYDERNNSLQTIEAPLLMRHVKNPSHVDWSVHLWLVKFSKEGETFTDRSSIHITNVIRL